MNLIRNGGYASAADKAVERQFVIELLAARPSGMWDIYEHLARTYEGLAPADKFDAGESSADFCWLQNLLYDMQEEDLIREDPEEDEYSLAGLTT